MPACCSTFERAADQQFTEKKAIAELKRYRTKGPGPTTRLLQDGIARAGVLNGTLLDIGSGVGSLTFGLLERGITHAVAVDASSAYNGVARQEAERVGRADALQFIHADFVSVAPELPVTTPRAICVVNGRVPSVAEGPGVRNDCAVGLGNDHSVCVRKRRCPSRF